MQCSYDVAVIGGAIAGASTAYLLKRKHPSLRILVIEKASAFDRKVGESTSEVGACFLTRVLNISRHLGHEQITKSGLRMWFYQNSNDSFTRCGELGPKHQTRLPRRFRISNWAAKGKMKSLSGSETKREESLRDG
jgi:L-2-hydroxyglutarate oxidase LhgO